MPGLSIEIWFDCLRIGPELSAGENESFRVFVKSKKAIVVINRDLIDFIRKT